MGTTLGPPPILANRMRCPACGTFSSESEALKERRPALIHLALELGAWNLHRVEGFGLQAEQ